MTDTEKKILEDFLEHIDCLEELSRWRDDRFNIFDVLKISRNEIRHSNVLAWLFNTNASHNLGDSFFFSIICRILHNAPEGMYDKAQIYLLNLHNFDVKREMDNIDLYWSPIWKNL